MAGLPFYKRRSMFIVFKKGGFWPFLTRQISGLKNDFEKNVIGRFRTFVKLKWLYLIMNKIKNGRTSSSKITNQSTAKIVTFKPSFRKTLVVFHRSLSNNTGRFYYKMYVHWLLSDKTPADFQPIFHFTGTELFG